MTTMTTHEEETVNRAAFLLAAALVGGCNIVSSDTGKLNVTLQVQLTDVTTPVDPVIQTAFSTLQVTHRLQTLTRCYDFRASATQKSGTVELVITTTNQGGDCPAGTASWNYVATISGILTNATKLGITIDTGTSRIRTEYDIPPASTT